MVSDIICVFDTHIWLSDKYPCGVKASLSVTHTPVGLPAQGG